MKPGHIPVHVYKMHKHQHEWTTHDKPVTKTHKHQHEWTTMIDQTNAPIQQFMNSELFPIYNTCVLTYNGSDIDSTSLHL